MRLGIGARFAPLACAVTAFLGSAAVGLLVQIPEPAKHDEFSYLLAADTFALGRLANPPHEAWTFFETFHVIQQPTYASKYPPAQGLALAGGNALLGHPIAGVWLSCAAMCAALSWMLQAWIPGRWALIGGLLGVTQYAVAGYWAQSYWGGALAATGGALLYGGVRRLVEGGGAASAIAVAVGELLLANTRPFEGALLSLPAGVVLAWHCARLPSTERRLWLARHLPPFLVCVSAGLAWMGYYNLRVTGSPWLLPYVVHMKTYQFVPLFVFGSLGKMPVYRHDVMAQLHRDWELRWYLAQRTWGGVARAALWKLPPLWSFLVGPGATLGTLACFALARDRWVGIAVSGCVLLVAGTLVSTYGGYPHYVAGATGLVLFLETRGLAALSAVRIRSLPAGALLVVVAVAAALSGLAERVTHHRVPESHWSRQRAALQQRLESEPGPDLVMVRYGPHHNVHDEWIYNRADIDRASVVWARWVSEEENRKLVTRFADRAAWILDVDLGPGRTRMLRFPN